MGTQLLPGERGTYFKMDPDALVIVGLDTPHKSGEHPLWDERILLPLDESMVKNIMALGVQESVRVEVEKGTDGSKVPYVVDGRRRVMHAREANKRLKTLGEPPVTVPVIAEKNTNAEDLSMLTISLNEIRKDDPMMVKAAKAGRMQARGMSTKQIALAFGVAAGTADLFLRLNGAHDELKKAVAADKITATAAGKLSELPRDEQPAALKKLLDEAKARGEKRGKVKDAAAIATSRKKGGEARPAPGKRILLRVVSNGTSVLHDEFIRGVRFAMGDLDPRAVSGLSALMTKK